MRVVSKLRPAPVWWWRYSGYRLPASVNPRIFDFDGTVDLCHPCVRSRKSLPFLPRQPRPVPKLGPFEIDHKYYWGDDRHLRRTVDAKAVETVVPSIYSSARTELD